MGNKKNKNKKSKIKANNWRGIIRTRKSKKYRGRTSNTKVGCGHSHDKAAPVPVGGSGSTSAIEHQPTVLISSSLDQFINKTDDDILLHYGYEEEIEFEEVPNCSNSDTATILSENQPKYIACSPLTAHLTGNATDRTDCSSEAAPVPVGGSWSTSAIEHQPTVLISSSLDQFINKTDDDILLHYGYEEEIEFEEVPNCSNSDTATILSENQPKYIACSPLTAQFTGNATDRTDCSSEAAPVPVGGSWSTSAIEHQPTVLISSSLDQFINKTDDDILLHYGYEEEIEFEEVPNCSNSDTATILSENQPKYIACSPLTAHFTGNATDRTDCSSELQGLSPSSVGFADYDYKEIDIGPTVLEYQPNTVRPVSDVIENEETLEHLDSEIKRPIVLEYQPNTEYSNSTDYFDEIIEIADESEECFEYAFTGNGADNSDNESENFPSSSEVPMFQRSDQFDENISVDGSDSHYVNAIQASVQRLNGLNTDGQTPEELSGRRVVDIRTFFDQIRELKHSDTCHVEDMVCTKEVRKGLLSTFEFRCAVCGHEQLIYSCSYEKPININSAAVLGITSIGLGAYHLNEFCANLEIPCMNNYMYDKTQKAQQQDWWQLAKDSALEALREEIRLAILNGDVDSSGNALIIMICDGSWAKRSYTTNFTSLSGCAVIIGVRTKKVIYFDVKDKYCHICKIAESRGAEPRVHECKKNYVGPSSSMETAIIIEGFEFCEKFGLRFKEYIADGDSSTYKNICDLKIYQNPEQPVEKDECCNHVYRNFRSAFGKLGKGTKKSQNVSHKLVTKKRGNDICKGVQAAAKHWQKSNVDLVEKLTNLEKDIFNSPLHYFGVHDGCGEYYCKKKTTPEGEKNVALLKKEGKWDQILNLCQRYFASNIPSMLLNYNNNPAESFNNLVAKLIGGKRINYCLAHSYRSRVARAVIQYNTGGCAGSTFHEFKMSTSSSIQALKKIEETRKRKVKKNAIDQAQKPKKPRYSEQVREKGVHYGVNCQRNDMNEHLFDIAKARYLEPLIDDQMNRDFVMRSTIGQRKLRKWRDMQTRILTSWYFSRIIKARSPSSYTVLLDDIVYKKIVFGNTADIRHQRIYEKKALECFTLVHGSNYLSECGIVVVKCPLAAFKKTIQEGIDKKLITFWKIESGVEVVNTMSDWYIEIQGELHVSGKSFAFVVVWVECEFRIEKIYRDDDFWMSKMEQKLVDFYENVMLKELVDPRKKRNMKLRMYNAKTKRFE